MAWYKVTYETEMDGVANVKEAALAVLNDIRQQATACRFDIVGEDSCERAVVCIFANGDVRIENYAKVVDGVEADMTSVCPVAPDNKHVVDPRTVHANGTALFANCTHCEKSALIGTLDPSTTDWKEDE